MSFPNPSRMCPDGCRHPCPAAGLPRSVQSAKMVPRWPFQYHPNLEQNILATLTPSPKRAGKTLARGAARAMPRAERMLEELEIIFLRDGFRDVTVEQLARHLHCSRRTLYDLAPSKEELFLRVFDRYLSRLRDEGNRRALGVEPEQAFVPFLTPAIDAARKLSVALMRDMAAYAPANAMWERHQRDRMAGLRALVERCVENGVFRNANPYLVAEVVAASLRRIREPGFLAASRLSYREAVAELYGLLVHGLLHPQAADIELKGADPTTRSAGRRRQSA